MARVIFAFLLTLILVTGCHPEPRRIVAVGTIHSKIFYRHDGAERELSVLRIECSEGKSMDTTVPLATRNGNIWSDSSIQPGDKVTVKGKLLLAPVRDADGAMLGGENFPHIFDDYEELYHLRLHSVKKLTLSVTTQAQDH